MHLRALRSFFQHSPHFLSAPPRVGNPLLSALVHLPPIRSGPMRFPWFSRANRSPRPRRFRPAVQGLEDRSLMSTVWVTPIDTPIDATHFHSLGAAMPAAGTSGTIIVEPGASPDLGTVNVNLDSLSIIGDAGFAPAALPHYDLNVSAPGVTLTNLNLGTITLGATANNVTVSRSQIGSLTETGAASGIGHNLISYNLI